MNDLDAAIGQLNSISAGLRGKIEAIDIEINSTRARINELQDMPISKADYMAYVEADIDKLGEKYASEMLKLIRTEHGQANVSMGVMETISKRAGGIMPYLTAGVPMTDITREAAYWLFGEQIKTRLSDVFDRIEWRADSVPVIERQREIKTLRESLKELELQRNSIAEQLIRAGVQG
jgi:hypothetical protein